ncbi:MAG: malectin domain-containing carbohydrate-binding protein [Candidatus Acidiferrales bacterium]
MDSVLSSETFGRAGNLAKTLNFICEKYFEGSTEDVREYDIAVHALGRSKDFDPQIDTVVRVTVHFLRKRLEQYYRTEGAGHEVQIHVRTGRYSPRFVRKADRETQKLELGLREPSEAEAIPSVSSAASEFQRATLGDEASEPAANPSKENLGSAVLEPAAEKWRRSGIWRFVAVILVSLCVIAAATSYTRIHARKSSIPVRSEAPLPLPTDASGDTVRALVGEGRAAYIDGAGRTWTSDTACSGGSTVSVPYRAIGGTQDPQIFLGERLGLFQCAYPVSTGTYEVHLLFSETSNLEESARIVALSVNRGPSTRLDVVFDTGGDNIETEKILTDVHPDQDGKIHIDSTSVDSYLNAVEILPGTENRMLPLRIYTGHTPYRDSGGNLWLPNRYFFGGRVSQFEANTTGLADGPLYATPWVGNFHYVIPVAHGETYRVRLHFRESLFTAPGSRVFDVWCNGTAILKDFDIFREAGSEPMTRTFSYVEPTKQDKIEIFFVPGVSYPLVDAIEVIPEPDTY